MKFLSSLTLIISLTLPLSVQAVESLVQFANAGINGNYTRTAFLALNTQPFDDQDPRRKLLIIGDSYAQDFLNMVLANHYLTHYQIRTHYTPTRCQIAFKQQAKFYVEPQDQDFCQTDNKLVQAKPSVAEANVLILVGRWKNWSARLLPYTLQQLGVKRNHRVIVIGSKDFGHVSVPKYLRLTPEQRKKLTNKVDPVALAPNQILRQKTPLYTYIDQQQLICASTTECPVFAERGELISYDGGHLTPAGAKWVGQRLFKNSPLGKL